MTEDRKFHGTFAVHKVKRIDVCGFSKAYKANGLICFPVQMRLLVRVDMPHNIVRQANDLVSSTLRHLGKAFGFGLVLESIAGEVYPWAMLALVGARTGFSTLTRSVHIGLDKNVDTSYSIKLNFLVFIVPPVAKLDKISSPSKILVVA